MSISELVRKNLDDRASAEDVLNEGIAFRNKANNELISLSDYVDSLTWQACQDGGHIDQVLDNVHAKAEELKANFANSLFVIPTPEQTRWLESQLTELLETIKNRGNKHILDLKADRYNEHLRINGGDGYTFRYLKRGWSVQDLSWTSKHPIPELKDRIKVVSDTVFTLTLNQRAIACELERINEELVKVDNKVMSTIYSDGERFVKVFKKTPGWKATPQEVMVQEFSNHLSNLKIRAHPAIEPIVPRSGKDPFLKVTFISDGEKRDFTKRNKATPNGYETRRLTPQAAQVFEKNAKAQVLKVAAGHLTEMGFHIFDKDIGSSAYPQFRPEFHLVVRLYISSLPGFSKDKPHSFAVRLDGSDIIEQVEKEMNEYRPKDTSDKRAPPATKPVELRGDDVDEIVHRRSKDLTYSGGARRRSSGTRDKSINSSHSRSLRSIKKKTNKRNSRASARDLNTTEPIGPSGTAGIPDTDNPFASLASPDTDRDTPLLELPPLEKRDNSKERRRTRSLKEVVDKISTDALNGEENLNPEPRVENAEAEASDKGNPLHGASAAAPSTLGTEHAVGVPEGTPAASSEQDNTPPKVPDDKLETIIEKIIDKETIVTSDDDEEEYYSDSDNQEDEVAESTLLKDSPETTTPDGITVLPKALTDTSKNNPDLDPQFESTPKKQTKESGAEISILSTPNVSKSTPSAVDKGNIPVPEIMVDQVEDVDKDDKSKPDTSSNPNQDLLTSANPNINLIKRTDKSPPIMSGYSPTTSEDSDFTEELPDKLLKIQSEASLISSPNAKNVFIDKSYWELIGSAAVKMGWNKEVLTARLNNKALYKSQVVRNSKKLLMSQLGSNIDTSYTGIGQPSQVETEEQLAFVLHLHDTISSVDINVKTTVKDKSQSTLRSYLKKPEFRPKKQGL